MTRGPFFSSSFDHGTCRNSFSWKFPSYEVWDAKHEHEWVWCSWFHCHVFILFCCDLKLGRAIGAVSHLRLWMPSVGYVDLYLGMSEDWIVHITPWLIRSHIEIGVSSILRHLYAWHPHSNPIVYPRPCVCYIYTCIHVSIKWMAL